MPTKKREISAGETGLPAFPEELLDQFVTGPMTAESVVTSGCKLIRRSD